MDEVEVYDGIWCCASLLHVSTSDMPRTLASLWRALKPGGALYVSFKHGEGEQSKQGRTFTDASEGRIRGWLAHIPDVDRLQMWRTKDVLPRRDEEWLNAIVLKSPASPRKPVAGGATEKGVKRF
ncbi:hypothetical protein GCM10028796_29510 [Ramlibacter monticola]